MLARVWSATLGPMMSRPARYQVAALCWRDGPAGREVLLATSLDTGRWILPKGWPKRGRSAVQTAEEEAWEEAGVRARALPAKPLGAYRYAKRLEGGVPVRTIVEVFAMEVAHLADDFPEAGKRERRWFTPDAAADAVEEPELQALLRAAAQIPAG